MRKLFDLYIDREFLVFLFFGLKISIKLKSLNSNDKHNEVIEIVDNSLISIQNIKDIIKTKDYVMVNLGCGGWYHNNWINIDYNSHNNEDIFQYNLNNGIPIEDNSVDVVYHSHVLEHLKKNDAQIFLKECHRILKPNGILRVIVPDLEQIVRLYLTKLEEKNNYDYDWIMLELFDQTVRNVSGGGMKDYLYQNNIPNLDFVISRIGSEGGNIIKNKPQDYKPDTENINECSIDEKERMIGKFRLGGEVHQWMYDRFSLPRLLKDVGFVDIRVVKSNESNILNFSTYNLDILDNGKVRKPESLFVECIKG